MRPSICDGDHRGGSGDVRGLETFSGFGEVVGSSSTMAVFSHLGVSSPLDDDDEDDDDDDRDRSSYTLPDFPPSCDLDAIRYASTLPPSNMTSSS